MSRSIDRLYELLPAIYRQRDAELNYPLRDLLRVITEQADVIEDDIGQLYENWFIETCQDWVVPYIGDLIGYRPVQDAGIGPDPAGQGDKQRNRILIPRREVANTIGYRRRKGTLALLELLANDVAGWPARAVEFYRLLGWMQHSKHLRISRGRTVDLREVDALNRIAGPFDELAHTVDVRRIGSHHSPGRYNIPNVGVFVWRLRSYPVTGTPAFSLKDISPEYYTFSVLGNDSQLYNRPQPEPETTHIADELNLPVPIRLQAFKEIAEGAVEAQASEAYYGADKSVVIWASDWPEPGTSQIIPREAIIPADLSIWPECVPRDFIAVDPKLGRIAFPADQLPGSVRVSYQYAFSSDVGGGEYDRAFSQPIDFKQYPVGDGEPHDSVKAALDRWTLDKPTSAVIEITNSGVYEDQIDISLQKGQSLQLRAANHARPVIRLPDGNAGQTGSMNIKGAAGSRFKMDGLLISGKNVRFQGQGDQTAGPGSGAEADICEIVIRHCTLVPGLALSGNCSHLHPDVPSLELINTQTQVKIEKSILGPIRVVEDRFKPIEILISDSIVDAMSQEDTALGGSEDTIAHAAVTILRSTIFGRIRVHAIDLAENSIINGIVRVARSQRGCMRFCYLERGSRTPRRYCCQPDLALNSLRSRLIKDKAADEEISRAAELESLRVRPRFNSTCYGTPAYCQLAAACAEEIRRGADDESEMGIFHDLYQPQRADNLRARLDEFTPASMAVGIIYAS